MNDNDIKNEWLNIADKLKLMGITEIADTLSVACENIKTEWYTKGFNDGYKSGTEATKMFNELGIK